MIADGGSERLLREPATPIVALDFSRVTEALRMVAMLGDRCRFYKVGLELFGAEGPGVVRALRASGCDVFLDLKFHDIPNTVRGAVRSAAQLGARLVTAHASGGRMMLEAAADGAEEGSGDSAASRCEVLAVTVLTSLDATALAEAWGRGPRGGDVQAEAASGARESLPGIAGDSAGISVESEVLRLAGIARAAGVHGVVCSGAEAGAVRRRHGDALALLVPGIRFAAGPSHDQARVVTPRAAVEAGARYVVLGRAVTGAADPAAAMQRVLDEIA